jgi:glycosyltransferase involved in cell wall biosynthesis
MVIPATLLMPVKNGEKYLQEAITNLEKNCQPSDEILVIDDGSTDGTASILNNWMRINPQVKVLLNSKSGLVNALNFGITKSSNDWIVRFDVDDRYSENRTFELKKLMKNDVVGVFSDYRFTTNRGINLGMMPSAITPDLTYLSLVSSQRTAHPSVCYNKRAVLEAGGYLPRDFPAEDLSLWLRLSKVGKIATSPEELLKYRISRNSVSASLRRSAINKKNALISDFEFNQHIVSSCVENLNETRVYYSNFKYGGQRSLLHLRDLLYISSLPKTLDTSTVKLIRREILKNLSSYTAGTNLLYEVILRKIYRLI